MQSKKALVTGAGSRLGRAMALKLAGKGFDVAVHYASSREAAESVAAEIRERGLRSAAIHADFLNEDAIQSVIPAARDALDGALSVLVNNASIFEHDDIQTADRNSWDRHMQSNLRAPFVLTQQFAKQAPDPIQDTEGELKAQALVVNMLDQRVLKLTPEFMTYTLAKMGLWAFTQTAAMALGPKVRVNAIGPGPTLKGARQSDAHFAAQRAATILGRGADADDITAALSYLLEAPAVTGQMICVDGGQHLAWKTPDVLGLE